MQTILGSNGQIGQELAKELHRNYTKNIRLVSRNPKKVNEQDQLYPANLLNFKECYGAIAGSDIVYFTVGLPMNSTMWEKQFPVIMKNVIKACETTQSKLVFSIIPICMLKIITQKKKIVPLSLKDVKLLSASKWLKWCLTK